MSGVMQRAGRAHAHAPALAHAHPHSHLQACLHEQMQTLVLAGRHARTGDMCARAHTHIRAGTRAFARAHASAYSSARADSSARVYTHAHARSCMRTSIGSRRKVRKPNS
jgi:hypothetical protein